MKQKYGAVDVSNTFLNISNQELPTFVTEALKYGVKHFVPPAKVDKLSTFTDLEVLSWNWIK